MAFSTPPYNKIALSRTPIQYFFLILLPIQKRQNLTPIQQYFQNLTPLYKKCPKVAPPYTKMGKTWLPYNNIWPYNIFYPPTRIIAKFTLIYFILSKNLLYFTLFWIKIYFILLYFEVSFTLLLYFFSFLANNAWITISTPRDPFLYFLKLNAVLETTNLSNLNIPLKEI